MTGTPAHPRLEAIEIPTTRLRLRPARESDIPDLVRLLGDPQVARWTMRVPQPYTEPDARHWLTLQDGMYRDGTGWNVAIAGLEDDALVGGIGLRLEPAHAIAELGYWIGVPFWNRGYATEAGRAALAHAFGPLALRRVWGAYFSGNDASGRVLRKLGMRPEGTLRAHVVKNGRVHDLLQLGILREEHTP